MSKIAQRKSSKDSHPVNINLDEKYQTMIRTTHEKMKSLNPNDQSNILCFLNSSKSLVSILSLSSLSLETYDELYKPITLILSYVENVLSHLISPSNIDSFFTKVNRSSRLIPRTYLSIILCGLYMNINPNLISEMIYIIEPMVSLIKHPVRGFYIRNFMIKTIIKYLPDKDLLNNKSTAAFDYFDTIKFLLRNLNEMNELWIRMDVEIFMKDDKKKKEEYRNGIKNLIGENFVIISSLKGLNFNFYQKELLPYIIKFSIISNDYISQKYFFECVIGYFPISFNIRCIHLLMGVIDHLSNEINKIYLLNMLMKKLSKFDTDSENDCDFNEYYFNNLCEKCKIFDKNIENLQLHLCAKCKEKNKNYYENAINILNSFISTLIHSESNPKVFDMDKKNYFEKCVDFLELLNSFVIFTVKCCPYKIKLKTINNIHFLVYTILTNLNENIKNIHISILSKILVNSIVGNNISFLKYDKLYKLFSYLDNEGKKELAESLINSISKNLPTIKDDLVSNNSLFLVLNFLMPKLESQEKESYKNESEIEMKIISKLNFSFKQSKVNELFTLTQKMSETYLKIKDKRRIYILPSLANRIISICYQISNSYQHFKNSILDKDNLKILKCSEEYLNYLDITELKNEYKSNENRGDEMHYMLINKFYFIFKEVIANIQNDDPVIAIKLYLEAVLQINSIESNIRNYQDIMISFLCCAINLYSKLKVENRSEKIKCDLIYQFSGVLISIKDKSTDLLDDMIHDLVNDLSMFVNVNYICRINLEVAFIRFKLFKDTKYINYTIRENILSNYKMELQGDESESLSFDIVNSLIYSLNKIILFIENGYEDPFLVENANKLIEKIKIDISLLRGWYLKEQGNIEEEHNIINEKNEDINLNNEKVQNEAGIAIIDYNENVYNKKKVKKCDIIKEQIDNLENYFNSTIHIISIRAKNDENKKLYFNINV